jgi:hypothetical protein
MERKQLCAEEICSQLERRRLPKWAELPDFELYMDQVIAFVGRCLDSGCAGEEHQLTSSMVNNYVKMGVMPAPVKKRYARTHLAHLLVICALKQVMPIAAICALIKRELEGNSEEAFYEFFCQEYVDAGVAAGAHAAGLDTRADADQLHRAALSAALRAQAEQTLATGLLDALSAEKTQD